MSNSFVTRSISVQYRVPGNPGAWVSENDVQTREIETITVFSDRHIAGVRTVEFEVQAHSECGRKIAKVMDAADAFLACLEPHLRRDGEHAINLAVRDQARAIYYA